MHGLSFSCRPFLFCFFASCNLMRASSSSGDELLPALAWLREHSNLSVWYDPNPPANLLDGRLTRGMCEKRILPDSLVYDEIDWYTYGEKKGEWLQRYSGGDQKPICWGEGTVADKWFDKTLAGENCGRPWMVMSEEDVPMSRFQQYTQEAPAVMGLDPLILEFCRNLTHDSRPVPHVNDPFWRTWKAAGMPAPEESLGPTSTLESNLLQACGAANRNILRVSAMAQAKTSWDMCANVEWVVCAAKGKLPNQGKRIEFSVPPGNVDGNLAPTYREYRSNIMRWSPDYEVDVMAWTFYLNEICFLSELCDNADELWRLKRGEPWVCKHTSAGEARLKDSLKNAYNSAEHHRSVVARMLSGGHVGGGHLTGGHVTTLKTTTTTFPTPTNTTTTTKVTAATMATIATGTSNTVSTVTKVAGTIEVEIDVHGNVTQVVLEEVFKRGIADALNVAIENVVKLTVVEIRQGSGLRRLQSTMAKQYEVSYEVIPPSSMDPAVVVDRANRITEAGTAESQVFRRVLMAQGGVAQVKQVVPNVVAYKFEEESTTPAHSTDDASGMSGGLVVLVVFSALLCLVLVCVCAVKIKRKIKAERRKKMCKRNGSRAKNASRARRGAQRRDMRQGDLEVGNPTVVGKLSHTLLDGDAHQAKKSEDFTCV